MGATYLLLEFCQSSFYILPCVWITQGQHSSRINSTNPPLHLRLQGSLDKSKLSVCHMIGPLPQLWNGIKQNQRGHNSQPTHPHIEPTHMKRLTQSPTIPRKWLQMAGTYTTPVPAIVTLKLHNYFIFIWSKKIKIWLPHQRVIYMYYLLTFEI